MKLLTEWEMDTMIRKLTQQARIFLRDEYDMTLDIPIKANGRLKKSMGRYKFMRTGEGVEIDIAKDTLHNGWNTSWKVLQHELIHYALHQKGLPFNDGDPYFTKELQEHGAPVTNEFSIKRKRHLFECADCGTTVTINRKERDGRYIHTGCGGDFNHKEVVYC